jgi:transitional endoplasmic reticulum ATPase
MKHSRLLLFIFARFAAVLACLAFLHHEWRVLLHHGSVHVFAVLVATLVAASLVWVPNRNVRGWTWTAFIVLAIGMTLLALSFTGWSLAAISIIATAGFKLWRLHQRRSPAGIVVEGTRVFIPLEMKITPQSVFDATQAKKAPAARERFVAPAKDLSAAQEVPDTPIAQAAAPARYAVTQRALIEQLVIAEDERILADIELDSMQWRTYFADTSLRSNGDDQLPEKGEYMAPS